MLSDVEGVNYDEEHLKVRRGSLELLATQR